MYTFGSQVGEERSAALVDMRNVSQKEMDWFVFSERFVGRHLKRFDIFTPELPIDSKRDDVRLFGSKNPDHREHLPAGWMQAPVQSSTVDGVRVPEFSVPKPGKSR